MEAAWQPFIALGANRVEAMFQRFNREMGAVQGQMPGKEEGRRTVKMNENKVKPVSIWCYQRQAGLPKALQREARSLIFLVFGVHMVNAEEQETSGAAQKRKRTLSNHRVENDSQWRRMRAFELDEWSSFEKGLLER